MAGLQSQARVSHLSSEDLQSKLAQAFGEREDLARRLKVAEEALGEKVRHTVCLSAVSLLQRNESGISLWSCSKVQDCTPSENSNLFPSQGAAYDQARAACESLQEQIKRLQRQLAELSRKRAREVGVNTSTSHTEQSTGTSGAEVGLEGEGSVT